MKYLLQKITIAIGLLLLSTDASPYQRINLTKSLDTETGTLEKENVANLSRTKREDMYDKCMKGITIGLASTQVLTGAAFGAAAGSVVPGLGTLIGAAIGSVVGGTGGATVGGTISAAACPNSKRLDQYNLNLDLGIIDDDDDGTVFRELKKLNRDMDIKHLYLTEKTDISARVVAKARSSYLTGSSVVAKYLIRRNLVDTSLLLRQWSDMFVEQQREMERQIREDVPTFSAEHRRTWLDDKKFQLRSLFHSLAQNIVIIKNDQYIKKLYHRVQSLESDLNFLKDKVEALSRGSSIFSLCGSGANFVSVGSALVPVVGDVVSYVTALVSATCTLVSEFVQHSYQKSFPPTVAIAL